MPRVTVPFSLEVTGGGPVEGTFLPAINPTTLSVSAGTDAAYSVTFSSVDGFVGMIQLSVLNLPGGASATITPNPASMTDTVAVVISTAGVSPGFYNLELEATETVPQSPLRKRL